MSRNVDRAIGIMATVSAGLAVLLLRRWLVRTLKRLKQRRLQLQQNPQDGDEAFKERYLQPETAWHAGSCHCGRIRLRVKAPRQLKAVEVPSKLRFPRISVKPADVDLLSEQHLLSTYSVRQGAEVGAHMFCSFCGMQIFVVPSVDPSHVLVNVDCLDRSTVTGLDVTFFSTPDSVPCIDAVDHGSIFASEPLAAQPQVSVVPAPIAAGPNPVRRVRSMVPENTETVPNSPARPTSSPPDLAPMLSIWAQLPKDEFGSVSSSTSSLSPKAEAPVEELKRRSGIDTPMHNKLKQHLGVSCCFRRWPEFPTLTDLSFWFVLRLPAIPAARGQGGD